MQLLRNTLLLAVVSLMATLQISSTVLAAENAGIGGKPANPREDNPRSQSIFVYELEPGTRQEDAVQVVNNTDTEKTLSVYAADSQTSSDGAFACAQKVDVPVSVGTWITLSNNEVTVPAQSSKDVPFTLIVPDSASAGEQNGCIVIQDSQQAPVSQSNGVALSFRSAIRVAVTVPGDITKQLDFSGPVVTKVDGETVRLSVGLKNNGNVSLDSDVTTTVNNLFGGASATAGGMFPVLARSEAVFNFEADKPFWGGFYRVVATATYDSGLEDSIGESGQTQTISSEGKWVFISPSPAALIIELIVAIVAVGAVVGLIVRRRHLQKLHKDSELYTVKKNESLQAIATKQGVSWKTIARLNKLKAPYHVEPGQELKIPHNVNPSSKGDETHTKV